jgi:hypothetical protein
MDEIQNLCEAGQRHLMRMEYWTAEKFLERAEELALQREDFDALARLYMPLQEARRQRRQRCGEGSIRLNLLAKGPADQFSAEQIAADIPQGQLLLAGWSDICPSVELRRIARQRDLYLETFLAAVAPDHAGGKIIIFPLEEWIEPIPRHSLVLAESEIPEANYGNVMDLWERLHAPFLAAADAEKNPRKKIAAYRKTIQVDYACELAHQNLAQTARELARDERKS